MKVALVHNLKTDYSEAQAEFDVQSTVDDIAAAIASHGHKVLPIEAFDPAVVEYKLRRQKPDLVFNIAEGYSGSRYREAFWPVLYELCGLPYTGSDPAALVTTMDKWMTKQVARSIGVATPRSVLLTPPFRADDALMARLEVAKSPVQALIVKPNYEGSSKGIEDRNVVRTSDGLYAAAKRLLRKYPAGVLVEEFIEGYDVTVPWIEGVGCLPPCGFRFHKQYASKFNLYDRRLKGEHWSAVRAVPYIGPSRASLEALTYRMVKRLGLRDFARVDFRMASDGPYFLEVNALPSLEFDGGPDGRDSPGVFSVAGQARTKEPRSYYAVIGAILKSATKRMEKR